MTSGGPRGDCDGPPAAHGGGVPGRNGPQGDPPPALGWDPGRCLPDPAGRWTIGWTAVTGSTNADLAAGGDTVADRTVLVAGLQTAGRGRLGRTWLAPAGRALTFSVLLRPDRVPPSRCGWAGALLSIAVARAVARRTGVTADLKWPNDVLVGPRKVAGVLAELAGPALVLGAGINLTLGRADLPREDATSLLLEGADPSRCGAEGMLAAVLDDLGPLLDRWQAAGGDMARAGLRAEYVARCRTIGADVSVHLPDGSRVTGRAVDVAEDGSIVLDTGASLHRFAAGDVRHLRAGGDVRHLPAGGVGTLLSHDGFQPR